MQVKAKIGDVYQNLMKCIEVSRQEMEYGCHIETSGGFFSKKEKKYPMTFNDYWFNVMSKVHPWKELTGIFNAVEPFDPQTEVLISCELADKMNILLKRWT